MKQREFHAKMPIVAAFIDALCEAFGNDAIHGQIRRGLAGEPTFFAQENGHTIGTRLPRGHGIVFDAVTQSPVDALDAPPEQADVHKEPPEQADVDAATRRRPDALTGLFAGGQDCP